MYLDLISHQVLNILMCTEQDTYTSVHIIVQQVENDLFIFSLIIHIIWSDINRLFHHKWVLRCLQIKKREKTAKRTISSSLRICWFTDWFANIFFSHSLWEFFFLIHTKLMIASTSKQWWDEEQKGKFLFEMVIKYLQCNQYPNSLMVRK